MLDIFMYGVTFVACGGFAVMFGGSAGIYRTRYEHQPFVIFLMTVACSAASVLYFFA